MITFTPANAAPYSNEWFNLFPSPFAIFAAFFIMIGFIMLGKYFWMLVYELRFGLGDEYITGKLTKEEKIRIKEKYPLFWKTIYNQNIKWRIEKWRQK
jgi:hypothetical protein